MVCLINFLLKYYIYIYIFSLTFVYSPPSDTYGYQSVELIPNGSHIVKRIFKRNKFILFIYIRM
jgi:hypothetical protein